MDKEISFEQAMKRLQEIVETLERNEESLENSLKLFEEGLNLTKLCESQLKHYEEKADALLKEYSENA